jgi:hypothetical protein
VFAEGRAARELAATTEAELAIDLLIDLFFYGRFITHMPFTGDYATEIVDHMLQALATGLGIRTALLKAIYVGPRDAQQRSPSPQPRRVDRPKCRPATVWLSWSTGPHGRGDE